MSRAITRGQTIWTWITSRAPSRAPSSIAATEIRRRAAWAPVAPATGLSAATPVMVSVSTGTASLRAVAFCAPIAAESTTIRAYRRPAGTGGAVSAAMITAAPSRTAWIAAVTPSSRSRPGSRPPSRNAGELRSGGGIQGPLSAGRGFVLVIGDDGGQCGDPQVGGGFAGRVLVPAAERGFDFACADAGAARAVQAGQDGAADLSGEVRGGGEDAAGAGDRELGGFDGDL